MVHVKKNLKKKGKAFMCKVIKVIKKNRDSKTC